MLRQPHFRAYFDKLLAEAHGDIEITPAMMETYSIIVINPGMTGSTLHTLVDTMRETFFPDQSFNQIRKKIFAAMGYRSTGLADAMRVRYTQAHSLAELYYPNMWDQFADGYEPSVFGSDFYGKKKYTIPYLEMLYEPHLILYQEKGETVLDSLQKGTYPFDNERFLHGFYLYLDLAQDKTASLAQVKDWAAVFSEIVDVSHTEALSMASIALGYKAWTRALAAEVEGTITNQRYQWAYA